MNDAQYDAGDINSDQEMNDISIVNNHCNIIISFDFREGMENEEV